MARKTAVDEPAVRKGLLVACGIALGVTLIAFVLIKVVFNGGGADVPPVPTTQSQTGVTAPVQTSTPAPADNEVTSGGRNPFSGPQGLAAVAPASAAPAAAAAAPAPTATVLASKQVNQHFTLNVVKVYGTAADVKFDDKSIKGVHVGDKLPEGVVVQNVGDGCASFNQGGKVFSVCQGQTVKR